MSREYQHPFRDGMEWRQLPGWEGFEISEYGHVRRTIALRSSPAGKILRPWRISGTKYWQVGLSLRGRRLRIGVHRLVAMAFHGEPPFADADAAHNDDDKGNNHYTNIRWATPHENVLDEVKNGKIARGERNGAYTKPERRRRGEDNGHSKLTEEDVVFIRASSESSRKLGARFGVSKTVILNVKHRKSWAHVASPTPGGSAPQPERRAA